MKNILIVLFATISLQSCIVSTKSNMDFVDRDDISDSAQILAVNAPVFLVKPFIKQALREDGENEEIYRLIRKIKKVHILVIQSNDKTGSKDKLKRFLNKHNYQEWASIKSEGQLVTINAIGKDDVIRKMLIAVKSDADQVYVDIKGNFSANDISNLINMTEKNNNNLNALLPKKKGSNTSL